jgi:hypothetical protein
LDTWFVLARLVLSTQAVESLIFAMIDINESM